jgi:hypothetical protein
MAKQNLAQKMSEVSKNFKFEKIAKQIKAAAIEGKKSVQVSKFGLTEYETAKLLQEGFTLENTTFQNYDAYIISW